MHRVTTFSSHRAVRTLAVFCLPRRISLIAALCGILAAAGLAVGSPRAEAQTGFPGGPVGSGFDHPFGVALDANGDVFVADTLDGQIKEIVAVNGTIPVTNPTINPLGSGFSDPEGVAVDARGDVFVTDTPNSKVYEIVAVNGTIPATNPTINQLASSFAFGAPRGIAVDANGDVFVSDTDTSAVYEIVASSGTVNTLGSNFNQPWGLAVDATGDVFVADTDNNAVKEIVASSGTILTLGSGFSSPHGVAVDAKGDVFVADWTNNAVKEIVAVNGTIPVTNPTLLTLGGSYTEPAGVAVDARGDVFIAGEGNSAVYEVLQSSLPLPTTPVGSTSATVSIPFTFETGGSIGAPVVSTQGATGMDFTDAGTGTCTTNGSSHAYAVGASCTVNVRFTPKAAGARYGAVVLQNSSGVTIATGMVQGTGVGPQVALTPGTITTVAGNGTADFGGDGGTATSAELNDPLGAAVDGAGNLYIGDYFNNRVRKVTASTGVITTVAGTGTFGYNGDGEAATSAELSDPEGVAVDGAGNLYIADHAGNRVQKVSASSGAIATVAGTGTAGQSGDGGPATSAELNAPAGLAVDGAGNLYIADWVNNRIRRVSASTGLITTVAGTGTAGYSGDGGAATSAELNFASGIAVDSVGNLYIADEDNNRIREVAVGTGVITTVAGTGTAGHSGDGEVATSAELNNPTGVAVDGAGDLYIVDGNNNRIREVAASTGVITTVAGTGGGGYSGDGGAATSAALNLPFAVALDSVGNLYIVDQENSRIREVEVTMPPTLTFATATAAGSTDTTDGSQTVTVSNIGNAALMLPTPTTGVNPSVVAGFTLDSTSSCPNTASSAGTLASGTNCTLAVDFAPTMAGPISGSLALTDNNLNAPAPNYATQTIMLSGTGTSSPLTATTAIASAALTANHAATPFAPVSGAGGTGSYSYSVSPALPTGLILSSSTGTISGTPRTSFAAAPYTVMVTDANSATASATFSLTVNGAVTATTAIASPTLTANHAATPFTPVTGAGGTAPLSYSVSPALPAGLSLSPQTGTIGGTPRVSSTTATYTVTVTDANSATASATFSLTVNGVVTATTAIASPTLTANHAAAPFTPVTGVGGTAPLSYSVSPALPAGLILSSSTGTVSGMPTASFPLAPYTVTVTDANNATASATFSLTVESQATPTITWAAPAAITYGTPLSATQLDATATALESAPAPTVTLARGPRSATAPAPISTPVTGTFTYTPAAGTMLPAGTQTLSVIFTPKDTTDYTTATASVTLMVNQATPTIMWAAPAAITAGTALSATQLDATASVPGTLTYTPGIGTMLQAGNQPLSVTFTPQDTTDYTTATATVTLQVAAATTTPVTPTLTFAPIASQMYGNAPFTVSATSASSGAVTYAVVSGPATVAGDVVTLTGLGTVVLSASQAAGANYTAATASTSFTVTSGFTITAGNGAGTGTGSSSSGSGVASATTTPGGAAMYSLTMAPAGTVYPDAVIFSATGLPTGATATFSPAMIPANSPVTPLTLTIQTSNSQTNVQTARSEQAFSGLPLAPVVLGFLLLPLAGLKRIRQMPRLFLVLFAMALSLGAVLGLSGCGGGTGFFNQPAQSYTVKVTATDVKTGAAVSTNVSLTVQ